MGKLEMKLNNMFSSKKEQKEYLKDNGALDIQYSGRTKTFYYLMNHENKES